VVAGLSIVACFAVLTTGSAYATGASNLPLNVTPSTGLTGGQSVTVSGSGYQNSAIGNILECNDATGQPTVNLPNPVGNKVSVSCNLIGYAHLVSTNSSGELSGTFTIIQGTVGPPCGTGGVITTCPTDSAGQSAAADAALYPCPPTAAQQAAGDICQLSYGDSAGDASVSTTILFAGEAPPGSAPTTTAAVTAPTTTVAHTTTTVAHTTASTTPANNGNITATTTAASTSSNSGSGSSGSSATSGGTLAATGAGPDLWLVAVIGFVALYLGSVTLALVDRPRGLLRRLLRRPEPASAGPPGPGDASNHMVPAAVPGPATTPLGDAWFAQRGAPRGDARMAAPGGFPGVVSRAEDSGQAPSAQVTPGPTGAPQGLWIEGWDPGGTSPT